MDFTNEIEAAVNWWAEQLGTLPNSDQIGLGGEFGDIVDAAILACLDDEPVAIPGNQIDTFKVALTEILAKALVEQPFGLTVRVDYDPDVYLAEALKKAGIIDPPLPFKTVCYIYKGEVNARIGNNSSGITIYNRKEG